MSVLIFMFSNGLYIMDIAITCSTASRSPNRVTIARLTMILQPNASTPTMLLFENPSGPH